MAQRAAKDSAEKKGHDLATDNGVDRAVGLPAEWREADPEWCEIARNWYDSLRASGQSVYYQQSDAEQAFVLAELLHRGLGYDGSPQLVRMWLTGARELLTTESARRGAHVRLDPVAGDAHDLARSTDDILNVIRGNFGERTG